METNIYLDIGFVKGKWGRAMKASEQTDIKTLNIQILDKDYPVNCPAHAESELQAAVAYLHEKIKAHQGKSQTTLSTMIAERILAMVALNLANEVLTQRHGKDAYELELSEKIERLTHKIAKSLEEIG